ncbi:MAG TPA: DNA-binding response regulator [Clostridiales bacterium]|nr:DNA-binding response regulator [Clostridiales bacterium]
MYTKTRILIVDDDNNICELVRLYLEKEGYDVRVCHQGNTAVEVFESFNPGLVILDIMLPGMDGWSVCREIRKTSSVPIIMLTARSDTFDKVLGLELGADDYLVKPFDTKELVARVKAVLRRYGGSLDQSELVYGSLVVNRDNYTLVMDGVSIDMPPKEFELFYFMAANPNKVFTRDQLLENIWGIDFFGDHRTVDVHIKRIREKVEKEGQPWQIKTVWGVGYKFELKQG